MPDGREQVGCSWWRPRWRWSPRSCRSRSCPTAAVTLPQLASCRAGCRAGRSTLQIADLDVGVLYLFAMASLGVYGIVLAGWSSNNKYSLLGRPALLGADVLLRAGAGPVLGRRHHARRLASGCRTSWRRQAGGWSCALERASCSSPAFVVYLIAATAEINRTPFDLPEAETELVAGFHTEYSSMKFALLQMAEYVNMITVSVARHEPVPRRLALAAPPAWLRLRLGSGCCGSPPRWPRCLFFFIWVRGTLPRFRYDQLMHFGWKVLLPLRRLLNIVVTAGVVALLEREA